MDQDSSTFLRLLRPGPDGALLCIPAMSGNPVHFTRFATNMPPQMQVYSFSALPYLSGERRCESTDELIDRYVDEALRLPAAGPRIICGYCFGALIGLHVAHRLSLAGVEIPLVLALDTFFPSKTVTPEGRAIIEASGWVQFVTAYLSRPTGTVLAENRPFFKMSRAERLAHIAQLCEQEESPLLPRMSGVVEVEERYRWFCDYRNVLFNVKPVRYCGDVLTIGSKKSHASVYSETKDEWLGGKLDSIVIDLPHLAFQDGDVSIRIGEELQQHLASRVAQELPR